MTVLTGDRRPWWISGLPSWKAQSLRTIIPMKLRPLILVAATAAFFAALARKRVEEARPSQPTETWEPVTYS